MTWSSSSEGRNPRLELSVTPRQAHDNLVDGELIAQKLDLGVADGGVVRRDGLRERDGQRLLGLKVILGWQTERRAELTGGWLSECPANLFLEMR